MYHRQFNVNQQQMDKVSMTFGQLILVDIKESNGIEFVLSKLDLHTHLKSIYKDSA